MVPVTTVTVEDEAQMEQYRGHFGDIWDKELRKVRSWGLAWPTSGLPSPGLTHTLTLAAVEETV